MNTPGPTVRPTATARRIHAGTTATLAVLAALALGPAPAAAGGISLCPGSASLAAAVDEIGITPDLATSPLFPGSRVLTMGSALESSPQLAGGLLLKITRPFRFMTPSGAVSGRITTTVIDAKNCTCDIYWQVFVDRDAKGRIDALTLRGYSYKARKELLADHRSDLGGSVPTDLVTRSRGTGSTISFRLRGGLGAGEVSKPMFFDTRIDAVSETGELQLLGVGGGASARLPTHMPSPPP